MPELVALVYRSDWRQLCLSARITSQHDRTLDEQLRRRAAADRGLHWPLRECTGPRDDGQHDEGEDDEDDEDEAGQDEGEEGEDEPAERLLLLAPGGRYRVSTSAGEPVVICDGESRWLIHDGAAGRFSASVPDPAFHGLLTPQWLLTSYHLAAEGRTAIARRPAHHVLASPRPVISSRGLSHYHLLDRVDALVDAELGILLRSEQVFDGQTLRLSELHDLIIDPPQAADPGIFALPPGMPVEDIGPTTFMPHGRGWQAAGTAAGLAAAAMGLAARYCPRRIPRQAPGDADAAMPRDAETAMPRDAETGAAVPGPVSDEVINLLHRTGLPAQDLTAELHQWADVQVIMRGIQSLRSKLPQPVDGILGPDALWDALVHRERGAATHHRTARLRARMPGEYRIDYLTGDWKKKYTTIACDGEHTRKVYRDRIATGPAAALDPETAGLIDPAWLLRDWRLAAAGEVTVAGRPGFLIMADAAGAGWRFGQGLPFTRLEVVVDAELGVLLRHTTYFGETPSTHSELRAVSLADGNDSAGSRLDASADFGLEDVWGLRAVPDAGGLLGDRNLSSPLQAAGTAAALAVGGAIAGAVAVTGWLEKHRARRD